jgi:hypothetical protein
MPLFCRHPAHCIMQKRLDRLVQRPFSLWLWNGGKNLKIRRRLVRFCSVGCHRVLVQRTHTEHTSFRGEKSGSINQIRERLMAVCHLANWRNYSCCRLSVDAEGRQNRIPGEATLGLGSHFLQELLEGRLAGIPLQLRREGAVN